MWLAGIRDIAIVMLALESIVIGILLAVTLTQIRKLIRLLREDIAPMLDSANETLRTVKGTTQFVSNNVVDPIIKASSYSTGTIEMLRALMSLGKKSRRRE